MQCRGRSPVCLIEQMGIFLFLLLSTVILYKFSSAADIITSFQALGDAETLVSSEGTFELGFFSPGSSKNRYLGIWYKNIPVRRVVWVANRVSPVNDSSGVLILNQSSGNLVIMSHNMSINVWSSNCSRQLKTPIVQFLDTGNLVLRDERDGDSPDFYAWQSFDYPSDTWLSGMKIGWDAKSGLNRRLTAWKNFDDPSPGETMIEIELSAYPEGVIWKGSQKRTRSGPWIGSRFSDAPDVTSNAIVDVSFIFNKNAVYFSFHLKNKSVVAIIVANETKSSRDRFVWDNGRKTWQLYSSAPRDTCDDYGLCGNYGICSTDNFPLCKCLVGFTPKLPAQWELADYSRGCVRNKSLNCSRENGFQKLSGVKLPDTVYSWLNQSMSLAECELQCLSNCACVAYTNSDIRYGGSGCAMWFTNLMDIRMLQTGGQDLYVRMPFPESGVKHGFKLYKLLLIIIAAILVLLTLIAAGYCVKKRRGSLREETWQNKFKHRSEEDDMELPMFDLTAIVKATENFSTENKLGEGGFGSVYKGTLEDGQVIAVKRLSSTSGQGQNEFRNEIILIAKLQHRNLVKLLGFCVEGPEKMLVYEFMPNGSLDHFIFDQTSSKILDFPKRFKIICDIARGLLYLHQDSRLRVIHRDLKASNVLLDNEMNAKIADFGMAKSFGGDQTEGNTRRVAGTYGYMAPEYAINGQFSIKSDVYSFGVLLLEIVSGKRNREFVYGNDYLDLIRFAWIMWTESRSSDLIDGSIIETCKLSDALRWIHVGLLCVQQHPEERPSMTSVVLMLSSEIDLPQPSEPAFFRFSSNKGEQDSINGFSTTLIKAR